MVNNEDIFAKHPELMELREFKTSEEIIRAFKNGGTMWKVWTYCGVPSGVSESPTKVIGVGTYADERSIFHGAPVYYYYSKSGALSEDFVDDLQCVPGKAVFTSKKRAEAYFAAARKAYASDPEWQKEVAEKKEEARRGDF